MGDAILGKFPVVGVIAQDTSKEAIRWRERAQIESLFDAFQKNIRVGFFTVPNGLVFDATEGGVK